MTEMVQVALAEDINEAEEIQEILRLAGIDAQLETGGRASSERDRERPAEGARPGDVPRAGAARDRGHDRPGRDGGRLTRACASPGQSSASPIRCCHAAPYPDDSVRPAARPADGDRPVHAGPALPRRLRDRARPLVPRLLPARRRASFDAGAREGYMALLFARLSAGGRVLAVEADPRIVRAPPPERGAEPDAATRARATAGQDHRPDGRRPGRDPRRPGLRRRRLRPRSRQARRRGLGGPGARGRRAPPRRAPAAPRRRDAHRGARAPCAELLLRHGYAPQVVEPRRWLPEVREGHNRWLVAEGRPAGMSVDFARSPRPTTASARSTTTGGPRSRSSSARPTSAGSASSTSAAEPAGSRPRSRRRGSHGCGASMRRRRCSPSPREKLPASVGLKEGRAEHLPFRDAWFDRVVMWLVVHLVDRPAAFREVARVLVPGGRLAVVTFATGHFERYWLNRFFPTIAKIDLERFPSRDILDAELRDRRLLRGALRRALAARRADARGRARAHPRPAHLDVRPPRRGGDPGRHCPGRARAPGTRRVRAGDG